MSTFAIVAEQPPLTVDADRTILVTGTRVPLDTVIGSFNDGFSVEEIVQQYTTLNLSDVYSVIAYYLRHKANVDDYLAQRQVEALNSRQQNEKRFDTTELRARLRAFRA